MITAARYRLILAVAVILFGAVLASSPLESFHGHERLAPCAICQLAHLPAIQPAIMVVAVGLEPIGSESRPGEREAVSEDAQSSTIPRAPPLLHAV
jgi:hypothetical protein